MMSQHFRLRSELSGVIAKIFPHAKNVIHLKKSKCKFRDQMPRPPEMIMTAPQGAVPPRLRTSGYNPS